jgi:hypothetical protein
MLVYLLRIDPKCIKVGMSSKSNLNRVKSYKDAKFLIIMDIGTAYLATEKALIREFGKKYSLARGREYFACEDDLEPKSLFLEVVDPFISRQETNPFARFAFGQLSQTTSLGRAV